MGLSLAQLQRAKELLDAAEVPAGGRVMRCTGRQFNHLRLSQGLLPAACDDNDLIEASDDGWCVLVPAAEYEDLRIIGAGEIGDLR